MSRSAKPKSVACPTCHKPVAWNEQSTWRPFCSERCRLIDLGEWLDEEKRIVGEPLPSTSEDRPD
jgi:endogenous inhibitor of DNA gyrase (YacG/DUF329 family)